METKEIARNLNHFVNEIRLGYKGTIDISLLSEASERLKELESEKENLIHYNADLNNQLNEAEFHIEKLKKQLSEKQPEWISVEDRLPEKNKLVLGINKVNGAFGLWDFGSSDDAIGFISHWMPLPEPPKTKKPTFKDVFLKAFPGADIDLISHLICVRTVFPCIKPDVIDCVKYRCHECWGQLYRKEEGGE